MTPNDIRELVHEILDHALPAALLVVVMLMFFGALIVATEQGNGNLYWKSPVAPTPSIGAKQVLL